LIAHYAGVSLVRGINPHGCFYLIREFRDRQGAVLITDKEIGETVGIHVF
jgi:hypothetical protein